MQINVTVKSNVGDIQGSIQKATQRVMFQVVSRGTRASHKLRNAALRVLNNPSPSAPGNPPGARKHALRRQWRPVVEGGGGAGGVSIRPTIYSGVKYAPFLEDGTRKMAARPFRDKVAQAAMPEIMAIYSEPYL